jgi:hypothetical protein
VLKKERKKGTGKLQEVQGAVVRHGEIRGVFHVILQWYVTVCGRDQETMSFVILAIALRQSYSPP